jgi:hypothetical protein
VSRHHVAAGWANVAKSARERLKAALPLPCVVCGHPVLPGQPFDAAHIVSLGLHGDVRNYGAAHVKCNRSEGGKLGAAMRKAPRTTRRRDTRQVKW